MISDHPVTYAYLRRSQNELDDPHILDRHRTLLLRQAGADGSTLPADAIYEEIGSGELIETRPVFLRLLRLWEGLPRDGGGLIYVVELARLTRGLLSDQGRVMDALMRAHLIIRTPTRTYDLRIWDDRFAFMAHGLVSNAELELTKQRFARAKHEMLMAGLVRNGNVPWGYRWSKEREQPEPTDDFPSLVRCCREIHQESLARLAARYGIPTSTLYDTLTNPMIAGWPVKHCVQTDSRRKSGKRTGHRMSKRVPRHLWIWPEQENATYPHACTLAEWEAIQQTLTRRRTRMEKTASPNGWCRDVVRFEGVDRHAFLGRYNGRAGTLPTYAVKPKDGPLLYISRELVHQAAEDAIRTALNDPEALSRAIRAHQAQQQQKAASGAHSASVEELAAARDRHRRQCVELLERELDAEGEAKATIATLRKKKEAEVERLTQEIQSYRAQIDVPSDLEALLPALPALAGYFDQVWQQATDNEKRALVNAFLKEIPVRIEPGARACWRKRTILPVVYREWVPGS